MGKCDCVALAAVCARGTSLLSLRRGAGAVLDGGVSQRESTVGRPVPVRSGQRRRECRESTGTCRTQHDVTVHCARPAQSSISARARVSARARGFRDLPPSHLLTCELNIKGFPPCLWAHSTRPPRRERREPAAPRDPTLHATRRGTHGTHHAGRSRHSRQTINQSTSIFCPARLPCAFLSSLPSVWTSVSQAPSSERGESSITASG